jgi:hypothetical protein
MTRGGIYLLDPDGGFTEMSEKPYETEPVLQALLDKHPELPAGDQIDSTQPRQWIVISREIALAGEERGVGLVDHGFLDQDGIPTLVEVKRSSDARIRREVVGQMLDYAANAVLHWPVDRVRGLFEGNCERLGRDPTAVLEELLGPEADVGAFWEKVATNLKLGRVRLIFVADEIPAELKRIVEFLNEQMSPAEVLAVEVKQYVGPDPKLKGLVPRLIGQTSAAERKGQQREGRQWDEASVFTTLAEKRGSDEVAAARKILEWARSQLPRFTWGHGRVDGSFAPVLDHGSVPHWLFVLYTNGRVEIQFQYMRLKPPFDELSKRRELLRRLNEIPGIQISEEALEKRPSIALAAFVDPVALKQFLDALDWAVTEIKAT